MLRSRFAYTWNKAFQVAYGVPGFPESTFFASFIFLDRLFRSAGVMGLSPTSGLPLGLGFSLITRLQTGQRHR